jgi:hypothetical protein
MFFFSEKSLNLQYLEKNVQIFATVQNFTPKKTCGWDSLGDKKKSFTNKHTHTHTPTHIFHLMEINESLELES